MSRPTAVHFGAGSIGRGFLGQLLADSGYEVVFVDVQPELLAALNERRSYPLRLVSSEGEQARLVGPVRAVNGRDGDAVSEEVARAALVSTAVGGAVLPHIAGPLAQGLLRRETPGNVLICENLPDPAGTFRELLVACEAQLKEAIGSRIGLAPCVVSRMVPVPDPAALRDPLEVIAEPYARLPVDAQGLVGEPPPVIGLEPTEDFAAYVRLKLFVHNAGHAAAAYHGYIRGYGTIHEAMADPAVADAAEGVMQEGCEALLRATSLAEPYLSAYRKDLLARFRNPFLGDTVERVGRDPLRKLAPGDRLVGAAQLALAEGITPHYLAGALAAALRFDAPGDPSAGRLQAMLAERGLRGTLHEACGLPPDDPLTRMIVDAYHSLTDPTGGASDPIQ